MTPNADQQDASIWEIINPSGRLQHCEICNRPVLGLSGQDQPVSERIFLLSDKPLPVQSIGWLHTRCVIDAGIGPDLSTSRRQSWRFSEGELRSGFCVNVDAWTSEVEISHVNGEYWYTTIGAIQQAMPTDGGYLVPHIQDINLILVKQPPCNNPVYPARSHDSIPLETLLNLFATSDLLLSPLGVINGRFDAVPSSRTSVLVGWLKYQITIPADALEALQLSGIRFP